MKFILSLFMLAALTFSPVEAGTIRLTAKGFTKAPKVLFKGTKKTGHFVWKVLW